MKGTRNTGFVVSLALLASLVGHFAIQKHFERRAQSFVDSQDSQVSADSVSDFSRAKSKVERLKIPRILHPDRQIVPALDVQTDFNPDQSKRSENPNAAVPTPFDASARDDSSQGHIHGFPEESSAVRDVIEHEMSHTSREERDIWFDELKTLPAGVVRDLLQVRKQIRALPRVLGGIPEKLASTDAALLKRPREVAAEPASRKIRFDAQDYLESTAALESAISQLRHNVTNAATPGFKRLRVTLVDAYSRASAESDVADERMLTHSHRANGPGEGCRVAPYCLDLKPGLTKKTDRQFDLSIDGEGFFVVQFGEKLYLTRCGAFTLDRERRICLATSNDLGVLQPPITVPEDSREVQISALGIVTALSSTESAMVTIGQIQLGRVASPTQLQPMGNMLYAANEASGNPILQTPTEHGLGGIQQGTLESSNVEIERELEEIDQLMLILKSLPPHNIRPVTANSERSTPKR